MGNSTMTSNFVGKNGTETITNIAEVSSTKIVATSKLQIGSTFILSGTVPTNTSASIVAAASALVTLASLKGAIFSNIMTATDAQLWNFIATNTASPFGLT